MEKQESLKIDITGGWDKTRIVELETAGWEISSVSHENGRTYVTFDSSQFVQDLSAIKRQVARWK
jgi:hypothetical protein